MDSKKLEQLGRALGLYSEIELCPFCGCGIDSSYCHECAEAIDFFAYDRKVKRVLMELRTAEGAAAVRAALARTVEVMVYHDNMIPRVEVDIFSAKQFSENEHRLGSGYLCNEPGYSGSVHVADENERSQAEITATLNAALFALDKGWLS